MQSKDGSNSKEATRDICAAKHSTRGGEELNSINIFTTTFSHGSTEVIKCQTKLPLLTNHPRWILSLPLPQEPKLYPQLIRRL